MSGKDNDRLAISSKDKKIRCFNYSAKPKAALMQPVLIAQAAHQVTDSSQLGKCQLELQSLPLRTHTPGHNISRAAFSGVARLYENSFSPRGSKLL